MLVSITFKIGGASSQNFFFCSALLALVKKILLSELDSRYSDSSLNYSRLFLALSRNSYPGCFFLNPGS
jgi:hypothetical protein